MKKLYAPWIAALFLMAGLYAPAQAQKIGYTNQEAILANMPEMEQVQQQLQEFAMQQRQELQQQQQTLQQQFQRYQRQQSLLSDSSRAQRRRELQQMQQNLQQQAQASDQAFQQRQRELMQPLLEELQTAIEEVAQSRSIDLVMRTQALLYVQPSSSNVVDITEPVAQKLGIDISGAQTAPAPTVEDTPTSGGN
ncbi:OmpH family outer membrane protein [Salisaeta longa]|uniref:OmpH family outer membrane protein n=1 Tax=Salisaeta longa TaxID=503170 RepID=UPI0003B3CE98|nr:OmpH family outer membrane protein [Salisaeta longa]